MCRDCGERWTVITPGERKPRDRYSKLSPTDVYRALTELHVTGQQMAKRLGVSRQAVEQIRSGITWKNAFPEIPRNATRRSCLRCRHWLETECGLGFPDPLDEGPSFANDCELYEV